MGIGSETSESVQHQASAEQLEAGTLVARLINSTPAEGFSAKNLLSAYPLLRAFPGCVVDLAYEQYCRDTDAGKNVTPTEFVKDFSNVQQSLYRILEFDQLLHEHPSLVEGVPAERWPKPGESFCEFQLEEQIGRGALSRVFVAREARLGHRQVVVKVCIRGAREADLLGKLECDGIARIHSVHADEATGLGVICMPYVTRVTMHHLTEWLTTFADATSEYGHQNAAELMQYVSRLNDVDPSLTEKTSGLPGYGFVNRTDGFATVILKWGITLARALAHAHHKDVLHLDVKPGNVLVLPDLTVSLLDFNLASSEGDDIRLAGGTLPYMASEQLLSLLDSMIEPHAASQVSPQTQPAATEETDVFGLCATLWHLVSGEPPFGVTVDMESRRHAAESMLERQKNGVAPEQIARIAAVLPSAAVELLLGGLSFERHERPAAATELAELLSEVLSDIQSVPAVSLPNAAKSDVVRSPEAAAVLFPGMKSFMWGGAFLAVIAVIALVVEIHRSKTVIPATEAGDSPVTPTPLAPAFDESAYQLALAAIANENFADAASAVEEHLEQSPRCKFIDLYCRTCSLPALLPPGTGMSMKRRAQRVAMNQKPVRDSWVDVMAEWEQLADAGLFPDSTWLNIAYIRLELNDLQGVQDAFLRAVACELPEADGARMKHIIKLMEPQENNLYLHEQWFHELQQDILNDGTRGEFLALLATHTRLISVLADPGSAEANAAVENLVDLFKRHKDLSGEVSGAAVLLKCRAVFESPFHVEIIASSRITDDLPPPRLHRVLVLPTQSDQAHLNNSP